MNIKDFLIEVKQKIATRDKWTQETFAKSGQASVRWHSEQATCYCLIGAARAVAFSKLTPKEQATIRSFSTCTPALEKLAEILIPFFDEVRPLTNYNVAEFNDSHTFEEVHAMLDKAIKTAT